MINVGIVGSRRRNTARDKELIRLVLIKMMDEYTIHVVSGGCSEGADSFAEELADELGLGTSIHSPDRSQLPSEPQYYDYVNMFYSRNTLIAEECHILLALPHEDRRGGTEDTIKKVDILGKPIVYL